MSGTCPAFEKIVSMSYQVPLSEYYRKSRALSYNKDSWRKTFRQNPVNIFPRKHPLAYIFLIFSKTLQFRRHFVSVSRRLVPSPPRDREALWDGHASFGGECVTNCLIVARLQANFCAPKLNDLRSESIHFAIFLFWQSEKIPGVVNPQTLNNSLQFSLRVRTNRSKQVCFPRSFPRLLKYESQCKVSLF